MNTTMNGYTANATTFSHISETRILRSAAGYYIGHLYWDDEMRGWFPWDRISEGYYSTKEEAMPELRSWIYVDCEDDAEEVAMSFYYRTNGDVTATLLAYDDMVDTLMQERIEEDATLDAEDDRRTIDELWNDCPF
jgi:hypothetical protein